jgi:hypothetical protein
MGWAGWGVIWRRVVMNIIVWFTSICEHSALINELYSIHYLYDIIVCMYMCILYTCISVYIIHMYICLYYTHVYVSILYTCICFYIIHMHMCILYTCICVYITHSVKLANGQHACPANKNKNKRKFDLF